MAALYQGWLHPPVEEGPLENAAIGRVVINDQCVEPIQVYRLRLLLVGPIARLDTEAGCEMKSGAWGPSFRFRQRRGTLDPDSAGHHLDESGRDRQSKTGPAMLSRGGGVGLRERIEDRALALIWNAYASVSDAKVQPYVVPRLPLLVYLHNDPAALRELDCVAHEVDEYLSQTADVPHQRVRDIGPRLSRQRHPLLLRLYDHSIYVCVDGLL